LNKLSSDFRIATIGAVGGLFTFSMFLLIDRVDSYYDYLSRVEEACYGSYPYVMDLWWIPSAFWHALLYAVASLAAHRYLAGRRMSPFLLWQVIGALGLSGWLLTLFTAIGLECLRAGNMNALETGAELFLTWFTVKFGAAVFAGNVAYGSLIQSVAAHYSALPESPCED
jgi:hypothetical protein